jgi:hypothetical protein
MTHGPPGNNRAQRSRSGWLPEDVKETNMIGILIAILLAAVVYWLCVALGLPAIIGIIAALLVLISGIGTGGYGIGSRRGV